MQELENNKAGVNTISPEEMAIVKSVLERLIDEDVARLNQPADFLPGLAPSQLQWTLSKTDLIELAYALHSSGAFNKGPCSVAHMVRGLENAFHIRLGNTSMTFQAILRRKSSTVFLERLKANLEMHIERIEDQHLR